MKLSSIGMGPLLQYGYGTAAAVSVWDRCCSIGMGQLLQYRYGTAHLVPWVLSTWEPRLGVGSESSLLKS